MNGRIALFLPDLPVGGVERVTINLAKGLLAVGASPTVVAGDASGPFRERVPADIEVVDLGARRVRSVIVPLNRCVRSRRFDAVIAAKEHANVVAAFTRLVGRWTAPLITTVHVPPSLTEADGVGFRGRRAVRLVRQAYLRSQPVAVSTGVADDLAATLSIPRQHVEVIENGVLDDELLAASRRHTPRDPALVVTVGRLAPQKDLDTLLVAFKAVLGRRRARLLIVGDGPERTRLQQLARDLGVDGAVTFAGEVDAPFPLMASAAVLALSSRFEGLPTVLIEGLALGCKVVSTDCVAGPREILDGGRLGRLVPVGDATALAGAIAAGLDATPPDGVADALAKYHVEAAARRYLDLVDRLTRPAA